MLKLLVPVDGSETSMRAIEHLLKKLGWYRENVEIHLLNVQQALHHDVGQFVGHDQLRQFHHDEGIKALAPARARLDGAKVPYIFHIGVGDDVAHTIAHYAKEKGIDQIVMGTHGRGSVVGMLVGSTTSKVLHLTAVPLLLVK